MDPARKFKESLTSRPELENSQGHFRTSMHAMPRSVLPPRTALVSLPALVRKATSRHSSSTCNLKETRCRPSLSGHEFDFSE
jgi:hypothetical protein